MIFCFSATGNSFAAAEGLRKALGDELVDIPQALRRRELTFRVKEGEKIGFVFPVYFFGLPTVVRDFAGGLTLEGDPRPYVYSVLTCGSFPAMADRQLKRLLAKRGLTLSASHPLPTVDNYILLYDVCPPGQQQARQDAASEELEDIIRAVAAGRAAEPSSGLMSWAATTFIHPLYAFSRKTRRFYALDTCTGCGLCEEICPSGAIRRSGTKPQWIRKRCAHCLGCIHRCPAEAVQYGRGTLQRHRYVHPALRQLEGAQVDAAAALGID